MWIKRIIDEVTDDDDGDMFLQETVDKIRSKHARESREDG